jgi:outer membrane protein assembly factor BamD (BamD/ComL family)
MKATDHRHEPCGRWVEGLESKDASALEHARSCPACREYLGKMEKIDRILARSKVLLNDVQPVKYMSYRKVSAKKIAVALTLAALLVVIPIAVRNTRSGGTSREPALAQKAPQPPPAPWQAPKEEESSGTLQIGDEEVTVLEAGKGEIKGRSLGGGIMIALMGPGRTEISKNPDGDLRFRHHEGYLAAEVPPESVRHRKMTVEADNVRIEIKGTIFAARATQGRIETIEVEKGIVRIVSLEGKPEKILMAGRMLEESTGTMMPLPSGRVSLRDMFFGGRSDEEGGDGLFAEEPPRSSSKPQRDNESIIDLGGPLSNPEVDLETWKKLLKKKGRTAEMLYTGGQIMRRLGRFDEAYDLFIEAAGMGKGSAQEKSLFLACQLTDEKIKDAKLAASLCSRYRDAYPQGIFAQEAMMIEARAYLKMKDYDSALDRFNKYIEKYPEGYQSLRAHLFAGKILVLVKKDCASAGPHIDKVIESTKEGKFFEEAVALDAKCSSGPKQGDEKKQQKEGGK